jgi:hypothetical protein
MIIRVGKKQVRIDSGVEQLNVPDSSVEIDSEFVLERYRAVSREYLWKQAANIYGRQDEMVAFKKDYAF